MIFLADMKLIFKDGIFPWFEQIFDVLDTPIFKYGTLNISMLEVFLGAILLTIAINLFWKGA